MMKISPLVLEIVLHYYHAVEDYPFGSDSSGMSEVINDLVIQGILKKCADPDIDIVLEVHERKEDQVQ